MSVEWSQEAREAAEDATRRDVHRLALGPSPEDGTDEDGYVLRIADRVLAAMAPHVESALAEEQARALAAKVAADGYRQRAERAEAERDRAAAWSRTVVAIFRRHLSRVRTERNALREQLAAVEALAEAGDWPIAVFMLLAAVSAMHDDGKRKDKP
jgi:hypothetical protein